MATYAEVQSNEGIRAEIQSWEEEALCKNVSTEIFFSYHKSDIEKAKKTCSKCPVREECLLFAVNHNIFYGIYGGLDPEERKRVKRRMERRGRRTHPN